MIVAENAVDFKMIEQNIFRQVCEWGCELLKQALERIDDKLMLERDRTVYRHKGSRQTAIKTVMGTIEFKRGVYERKNEDGNKSFVYLLDEALGRSGSGFFSSLLSEQIVRSVCESSYRSGARAVSEQTGQTVSHTAAWQVVQSIGERVNAEEQRIAKAAAENKGAGELETPILFEEQDGIWLNLQGKSRKQYGKNKEMKLAIAYDGAKKTGKKRFELTNKVACANFESNDKFQKRKEGIIANNYNVDEIEMRFLNGDGANWIKAAAADESVHLQLDVFHRNKAVITYVSNPDMRKEIFRLLYTKQTDLILDYVEALSNSVESDEERQNLLTLLTYFTNNKDGLVPCHRRGLDIPEPSEGKEYRHMGAMESNVFSLVGNRMKGRRACWSIGGGNNLARLLCLKATKKLSDALQSLTAVALPERYSDEIVTALTSTKVAKPLGKGYNGFHQAVFFPATPDYKWLRDIGTLRPLS